MNSCKVLKLFFIVVLSTVNSLTGFAQQRFTIEELVADGQSMGASSIDDSGRIVGNGSNGHAVLWQNGVTSDLGTLGGLNSSASHINNHRQIVGASDTNSNPLISSRRAFLWENGGMSQIRFQDPGSFTYESWAIAINDSAQVVGSDFTRIPRSDPVAHNYLWENGISLIIPTLGSTRYDGAFVTSINNRGSVCGTSALDNNGQVRHAFLWASSGIIDLGTIYGDRSSASDVSDSNVVVGWSTYDLSNNRIRASRWQNGTMVAIDARPGTLESAAIGINNKGQIVGVLYGQNHGEPDTAFIWDGVLRRLNDMIDDASWFLTRATSINDRGEIIGQGMLNGLGRSFLLKPVDAVRFYHQISSIPSFANPRLLATSQSEPVRICADGSQATLVTFKGRGADSLTFKIAEDADGENETFGMFSIDTCVTSDSAYVWYTHPNHVNQDSSVRHLTMEVIDDRTNKLIKSYPMSIYRATVVMVHGIWSDASAFVAMEAAVQSNLWPPEAAAVLSSRWDYGSTSASYFSFNSQEMPRAINSVLLSARLKGYSAGKATVVGHSAGGILSRLFIQSYGYRNQISRLITINTPHAGAQCADFLLDDRFRAVRRTMDAIGYDTRSGVVSDLRVMGSEIRSTLNGDRRLAHNVPSHAIVTYAEPTLFGLGWLYALMDISATNSGYHAQVPPFMNDLFDGDQNDGIVPIQSQHGGLPFFSEYPSQIHTGATANENVINRVVSLLKGSSVVFSSPFNPPTNLTFNIHPPPLSANPRVLGDTSDCSSIVITNPPSGSSFQNGQLVSVGISAGEGIDDLALWVGNETLPIQYYRQAGSTATFDYVIPQEAVGKINVLAIGFTDSGSICMDTIVINTIVSALLDSIKINARQVYIPIGQRASISALGYYSDSIIRNLRGQPDIDLISADESIVLSKGSAQIEGISEGTTSVEVFYGGATTQIDVTVLPGNAWQQPPTIAPVLQFPMSGSTIGTTSLNLIWNHLVDADYYQVQTSYDSAFTTIMGDHSYIHDTLFTFESLVADTQYYWRVSGANFGGVGPWSTIWNFRTDHVLTDVVEVVFPNDFILYQNFPNPFNPNTMLRYALPTNAYVTLKIYNLLGQEVATLVDEIQETGYKSVEWNSTNNFGVAVGSGIYFYRIQAGDFVQTRKMVLLK